MPPLWLWLLLCAPGALRAEPIPVARDAAALEETLAQVRAERKSLSVRPDRWETRFKIPAVEALLGDPLQAPEALEGWSGALEAAQSLSGLVLLGSGLLSSTATAHPPSQSATMAVLPSTAAAQAISEVLQGMAEAQPLLERSLASLRPEERTLAAETFSALLMHEPAGRREGVAFAAAGHFDADSLLSAAATVTRAVDRALPVLQSHAVEMRGFSRKRWATPLGDVLVCGLGDDIYGPGDLDQVALLVDFGGDNLYRGAPAAAGAGQQRVVIDLGENVRVEASSANAGTGSGVLGIGLLYLPNPAGSKTLRAGDFSLGAGLFGVGGLFARGRNDLLEGGRFTSGAGAFGLGLLYHEGEAPRFSADLAGQGFAFTRGAGLFVQRGSRGRLSCGLRYPDSHEAQAQISLCQGMGQGPRAFAAGGVGLAYVRGDDSELRSSYFAQGSGYWHGLGGLFVSGRGNRLLARRYAQGAGIHTALGALVWNGQSNRTRNWGVGPGFGWDYGIGLLLGEGDDNEFAADWASGAGDVNGHALVAVRGRNNRLALGDLGKGQLKRGSPSYGLVVVQGQDNRYLPSDPSPWGVVQGDGLAADPQLRPSAAEWPAVEREATRLRDRERLQRALAEAQSVAGPQRLAAWLAVLADEGLDSSVPVQAAVSLLALAPEAGSALARLVDADRFDEYVWLRLLLPAFGRSSARLIVRELAGSPAMRQAVLLRLLSGSPARDAAPAALSALSAPDWRVRRAGVEALAGLFSREEGEEPGRLPLLEASRDVCREDSVRLEKSLRSRIGARYLWDLLSVLAMDEDAPPAGRIAVFLKDRSPMERFGPDAEATQEFLRVLKDRAQAYGPVIERELWESGRMESVGHAAVLRALQDPEPEVVQAALIALGRLGQAQDAPLLAEFLARDSGLLREAAATGLAKMGPAGRSEIRLGLQAESPRVRAFAALAAAQSSDAAALRLLSKALRDRDPQVRRTAVAGLWAIQSPLRPRRKEFLAEVRRLERDPDAQVRHAAAKAAQGISRE